MVTEGGVEGGAARCDLSNLHVHVVVVVLVRGGCKAISEVVVGLSAEFVLHAREGRKGLRATAYACTPAR